MLVLVSRCLGCSSCVVGCKNWHDLPANSPGRVKLMDLSFGSYPQAERWMLPILCMHCSHPPCVAVCRFEACKKDEDGVVVIDPQKCVGCELCVVACPYGARYLRPDTNRADGCDFCRDRFVDGKNPLCVDACTGQALIYGDLDDPGSDISRLVKDAKAKPILTKYKTKPSVYYSGLSQAATSHLELVKGIKFTNGPKNGQR